MPVPTGSVLFVVDEHLVRDIAEMPLSKAGYTAVCLGNGGQPLDYFHSHRLITRSA